MMRKINGIRAKLPSKARPVSDVNTLPGPELVILPLSLPWGRLSSLVRPGEKVVAGQKIAEHPDGILPPLRSSISGRISAIKSWIKHSGEEAPSIFIEAEEMDTAAGGEHLPEKNGHGLAPDEILRLIFESGIREMDPYPWPLHIRLAQPALTPPILFPFAPNLRKPIEFLILNGMDRQPGVTLRLDTLNSHEEDLIEGISMLRQVSVAGRTILAVSKSQNISERLQRGLGRIGVEIVKCPDKYPISLEPMLVKFVSGKEIPLPSLDARSIGVVVVDIITVLKVFGSVKNRLPCYETVLHLAAPDHGIDTRIRVKEGTLLEEALNSFPLNRENISKVILGGPLLGYAQHNLGVPLTQEIDSVILQGRDSISKYANQPCINCGYCARACPIRLVPSDLSKYCEYGRFIKAEKIGLFACIECGICSYVCPARRPMIHLIRFGKKEITVLRGE